MKDNFVYIKILEEVFRQKELIPLAIDWWIIDPGQVILTPWPAIYPHRARVSGQSGRMAKIF
jgi:hypothetical protein